MALADVDLTSLSRKQLWDYRQELIQAMRNPGIEFEMVTEEGEQDAEAYYARMKAVDTQLATFSGPELQPGKDGTTKLSDML